jgi:hypothetical protein
MTPKKLLTVISAISLAAFSFYMNVKSLEAHKDLFLPMVLLLTLFQLHKYLRNGNFRKK